MAELKGQKRKQPSSCPEGWEPAAMMLQLELTCRQERYSQRCVGIARFVYNRMVGNDQAGRDTGLWLTPHELEKEFNAAKHINPALAFTTEVSKFVAQGACRNYRNAWARWLNKKLKARRPVFHRKNRTGTGSFLAASGVKLIYYDGHRRIRLPYLGSVRMTRSLPEGIPDRGRYGLKSGTNLAFHQSSSADPPGPEQRLKPSFQVCKPYSETSTAMRFTNMARKYLPLSAKASPTR